MPLPTQRLRIHTEAFRLRAGLTDSIPLATSVCSDFPRSYSASVQVAQWIYLMREHREPAHEYAQDPSILCQPLDSW